MKQPMLSSNELQLCIGKLEKKKSFPVLQWVVTNGQLQKSLTFVADLLFRLLLDSWIIKAKTTPPVKSLDTTKNTLENTLKPEFAFVKNAFYSDLFCKQAWSFF